MGFLANRDFIDEDDIARIKSDRRFLQIALEEASKLLNNGRTVTITGTSCCCPFHADSHPSGSIHRDRGAGPWLFTCHRCDWNDLSTRQPRASGDALAVLQAAHQRVGQELSFQDACRWLLEEFEQQYGSAALAAVSPATPSQPQAPIPQQMLEAQLDAQEAHQQLIGNPIQLGLLWESRAISAETAKTFGVGYIVTKDGREWWTLPIRHADGTFMALKRHAADGLEPKSRWEPKGAKVGNPPFPVDLSKPGIVVACSGELKGLAVIDLGFSAFGITSGETNTNLPDGILDRIAGREVAIPPDNDETGRRWSDAMATQLVDAGCHVRIVQLPLTQKGEDINDWIVERRIRQSLCS